MESNQFSALLYQHKLTVYSDILGGLHELISELENNVEDAKEFLADPKEDKLEVMKELSYKVADACFTFQKNLISQSLVLPATIYHQLSLFCDKMVTSHDPDSEHIEAHDINKKVYKTMEALIQEADDICQAMRKDLAIEPLQDSVFRRLAF